VSATEVDRWIGVAHEMDFLSPVLTVSPYPISVLNSEFVFTDTGSASGGTPETMNRLDRWQSLSPLTWTTGPGFQCWNKKFMDIFT
jgi:hypothetical protein